MNNSKGVIKHTEARKDSVKVSQHEVSVHSGPLPDPNTLRLYDEIIPGAAQRILSMAESEQKHRHEIDDRMSGSAVIMSYIGIIFAFLSVIIISLLVFYALSSGFDTAAASIAVGAIATVAGVFIFFKRSQKESKGSK